jgi:exosortase
LGVLLFSPWFAALAALLLLLGVAYGVGGWLLLRQWLPAWSLLWLAIPPPLNMDQRLVLFLQAFVSRVTGKLLDLFGILHVRMGHVIDVPGKRLLVEEACSGIQSLFAIVACTLFLLYWQRRNWLRGGLLFASAIVWVVLVNIVRLMLIVLAQTYQNFDLTVGWQHEVLGWFLFALTVSLIWSTDHFIGFLLMLNPFRRKAAADPAAATPVRNLGTTHWPDPEAVTPTSWRPAIAFGLLALVQGIALGWPDGAAETPVPRLETQLAALRAESLPPQLGGWQRHDFEGVHRERDSAEGEFSRVWRYAQGQLRATVSLDYPFNGWHALEYCYISQGWAVEDTQVHREGPPQSTIRMTLRQSSGRAGYTWFSLMDDGLRIMEPPTRDSGIRSRLQASLRGWLGATSARQLAVTPTTYQIQVFLDSYGPLSSEDVAAGQDLFLRARDELRKTLRAE